MSKKVLIGVIIPIVVAVIAGLFGLFQGKFRHQPGENLPINNTQGDATYGPQSPIIKDVKGDVSVSYLPQSLIDRWEKILKEQGMTEEEREARLRKLETEFKSFRSSLTNRPTNDEVSKQILEHLSKGNFSEAETVLKRDLERNIQSQDFQTASLRAKDLSHFYEIQLASPQVTYYANLADNLRREGENTSREKADQAVIEPELQQQPSNPFGAGFTPPRDPKTGEPLEWGGRGPLDWHRRKQ